MPSSSCLKEGPRSLGNSCALEEEPCGRLSNTQAPSVFGGTQSSLKGESNPIDKSTLCVNTLWEAKDICPIPTICLRGVRLLGKEIAIIANLLYIAKLNDKEMVIRNLTKENFKQMLCI